MVSLLLLASAGVGCQAVGYAAHAVGADKRKVKVAAAYRGLENKRVAVLVAADELSVPEHPAAPFRLGRAVSQKLAFTVPGVRMMDPKQLAKFQQENLYWKTMPYGELLRRLGVERLVYVDLLDFETHEERNAYVWQGRARASVNIASSDAPNPDDLVFSAPAEAAFPPDEPQGTLNASEEIIETGLTSAFADAIADLFRDHTKEEK